jgi:hypothetical protein
VILVAAGLTNPNPNESAAGSASPAVTQSSTPRPTAVAPTTAPSAPQTARVPDVTGKRVETAKSKVTKAGFVVQVKTKLTNVAPAGIVLHETHGGDRADVGAMITLTVAKSLPKIPRVVGESITKAKATLKQAGFEIGKVTQLASSQRKGTVLSQTPVGGTSARPGRSVSLVIAKPAPSSVNGNPWGFNFSCCSFIYQAQTPGSFCSYFRCEGSFFTETGYIVECQDGTYGHAGGISGSCSSHGGNWRPLLRP